MDVVVMAVAVIVIVRHGHARDRARRHVPRSDRARWPMRRKLSTHPNHLPWEPVAIVSWLRFCSASLSSTHCWKSASVSWTVTLPRIL